MRLPKWTDRCKSPPRRIVDTSHTLARFFAPFNQPDGPKAYPKVDDANDLNVNGNRYSMIFAVSSLNGEAIADIGSTSS